MSILAADFCPEGITVHRDPFHESGLRVYVMRDSDREVRIIEILYYKKVAYRRTGLFSWERYEATDHERMQQELTERGWAAVRELVGAAE